MGTQVQNQGSWDDVGAEMPVDPDDNTKHYGFGFFLHLGTSRDESPVLSRDGMRTLRATLPSRTNFETALGNFSALSGWWSAKTTTERDLMFRAFVVRHAT
jgi:hypothetical protein